MASGIGMAVIRGWSMLPTLRDGDRLLIAYGVPPSPGSLVVVRLPGRPVAVKRAVRRVPEGWWVERDNVGEGSDSWLVGAVPDDDVLAVVLGRLWPPRLWLPQQWLPWLRLARGRRSRSWSWPVSAAAGRRRSRPGQPR